MENIKLPNPITQTCAFCVMDNSDPQIEFDSEGVCNHCKRALMMLEQEPYALPFNEKEEKWQSLISEIKAYGKNKKYDCLIGLSGGVDSTYVAYVVKKAGLRPLAVHLDNGWNSELSVMNIESICRKLDIELFTKVLNWEEFKSLQLAFLKASTPDSEVPTDHAIFATLFELANKFNIKYILTGINIATESILPQTWSYGHWDWKYIKNINKLYGSKTLHDFPHYGLLKLIFNLKIKKIKWVSTLNYVLFNKADAKKIIQQELDWKDYGGKHHESIYTKFFQTYILPRKFGIDKRKAHLSALICSNQITREEALKELKTSTYSEIEANNEKEYLVKKFGISADDFERIMDAEPKTFHNYPSNWGLINKIQTLRKSKKNV
jgi:N-acetyl sugar amidotransferase